MKTRNTRTLFRILVTLVTLSMLVVSCAPAATQEAASSPAAETGQETASTPAAEASQGEAGSGEISVLYLDDPTFWSEQAQRFTEASGNKVNWEGVPFLQLHDKMLTALATGDSPWDVIHVRDDYVAEFASRGFLLPLDDLITPEMKAQSPEQAWENLSWDGHIYGIPRYFWVWQFYYNTDILSSAGITEVPTTWDEVAQAAEAITADTDGDGEIDRWGYCEPWGENFASYPFLIHLRAAGGDVFDADGNPTFNSEAGVKALTWMVEYAKTDNYCPSAFELMQTGSVSELFAQGNIGMIASTTQTFRLASDPETSRVVGKVNAALLPGDVVKSATFSETGALGIPATAKNPELALEYIKFVTSVEEEKNMALTISSIPAVTEALDDPEVQAQYPHFQYIGEQMEYPFGMIKHPNSAEVNAAIARNVILALHGDVTPQEALDQAYQEVMAIGQ